jgi:NAD(P)-dependent dehydrogenase (short-subunit alcohol dehydrogenase family)
MVQRLSGKSAVVTGSGSGGIGREVALALAAEGAQVVVNDIGRGSDGKYLADKVVDEITKAKGVAVANYDSVATMQGGENIINTAITKFGKIDILVNCAGNFKRVMTLDMKESDWDSIIDVHLKGHFACAKAALTEMVKQKSGRIINFSSRSASGGAGDPAYKGGSLAYCAAKAGILAFTTALSGEFKEYGITVNAILPSADTKLFPGKIRGALNIPNAQWMDPDYVAPIVTYLATDEARDITGRFFYAAGGDICIFPPLLQIPNSGHIFIRKMAKWTVDDLGEVIPIFLGLR